MADESLDLGTLSTPEVVYLAKPRCDTRLLVSGGIIVSDSSIGSRRKSNRGTRQPCLCSSSRRRPLDRKTIACGGARLASHETRRGNVTQSTGSAGAGAILSPCQAECSGTKKRGGQLRPRLLSFCCSPASGYWTVKDQAAVQALVFPAASTTLTRQ